MSRRRTSPRNRPRRRQRACGPGAPDDHRHGLDRRGRHVGNPRGSPSLHPIQTGDAVCRSRSIVQSGDQDRRGRISKTGSPLLRTLLVEAAHSLAQWDSGPLGHFYARKAQGIGPRKAIIALARKLLIVAWRMLLTGEVYRATRATTVARKHRELQNKIRIQMPSTVPVLHSARVTRQPTVRAGGTEGIKSRRRTLVST